jgi:two-component system sensor histidine kinase KdpD
MTDDARPDPDALLARVQAEMAKPARGRLKIFFGAAAGVGKTFAMLEAAHERQAAGVDMMVGWLDTHGRAETEALLVGLEVLPRRPIAYRDTAVDEFDLDAALARHPSLILVDELAHTNVPGARHTKRWQDVEELLQAGIDVYTTVNVQHIESLNDVVAQITGVVVRETVPDLILEQADEVELIDLPPDELLQRLRQGKVYIPQQAERALHSFFRKGNLIALRELALRRTAERVDAQMQAYMRDHAIPHTWPAVERILVCVSPSPLAIRLVRAARRMAAGLHVEWIVVNVETPAQLRLPEAARDRVVQTLRLAEQLGAQTVTLSGQSVSDEILTYARGRNVTRIVVGKPTHPRWRDLLFGSMLDAIVRGSGEIDVHVISGEREEAPTRYRPRLERTSSWAAYGWAVAVVVAISILCQVAPPFFAEANLIMLYLLGVVLVAARLGRGPSVVASILSVAAFDFFFVLPYLTFAVSDTQYVITFGVMLTVALVISTLTARLGLQAKAAREREQRTAALYALSRELASTRGIANLLQAATRHVGELFHSRVSALVLDADGKLRPAAAYPAAFALDGAEQGVAQWVYAHGQMAGLGADTLPGAQALYVPLVAAQGTVGVLGIRPDDARALQAPEQMHLLETFANQTAVAVERARLADEAERKQVQIEAERLRSTLLSSISHDLRTPLASITGAASSLAEEGETITPAARHDLAQTIYEEATRLNRLVSNLLDMTRLASGTVQLRREWQSLEEVIGEALARLDPLLAGRAVNVALPPDLPLVQFDIGLVEQLLINLLENAAKYSPPVSPIDLCATRRGDAVLVEVADCGPGIKPGDETRIFDKFYRGPRSGGTHGAGLGLAICRAIVEVHGGRIWVTPREGGGSRFCFTLPFDGEAPVVPLDGAGVAPPETSGERGDTHGRDRPADPRD